MRLKLKKQAFSLEQDVYLCGCYVPRAPSNSPKVIENPFELIENDIVKRQDDCDVLLLGDMNSRTGSFGDYADDWN